MSEKYSVAEIVKLGIEIEKNGNAFYAALTENAQRDDIATLFRFLAEQEKQHVSVFKKILESVEAGQPQEIYPDDYFAYMHDLASEHVFLEPDKGQVLAERITDDKEAITLALMFEESSIRFFENMKKGFSKNDKEVVNKLIEQEKEHIQKIKSIEATIQ